MEDSLSATDETADLAEQALSLAVEHVEQDQRLHDVLALLIHQYNLFGEIVSQIYALVPDLSKWRLTLSGDISATVNTIEGRDETDPYTTSRGAGHVGGVTIPKADGTFDIVLGAEALVSPHGDHEDLEGLIENAMRTGRHLGRHEAGHVLLRLRNEDAESFRSTADLSPSAAGWTDIVAAYMDDFRIERHVRDHTPPVYSHLDGLPGAVEHVSSELRSAKASWSSDIDGAARRSDIAVSGLIRVISYLASELGVDEDGTPAEPERGVRGWDRYLANDWAEWSSTFHKLRPVDEAMSSDELAGVLAELCELASRWSRMIGYDRGITDDGRMYAFWTADSY